MTKKLLILSLVALMTSFGMPSAMHAAEGDQMSAQMKADGKEISIAVHNSSVEVSGAQGMTLKVVSLTGRLLATIKIESPSQRVELNLPKGCYILQVGTVVRKISLKQ